VLLEGLGELKNAMTSSGIETATFRLAALCDLYVNLTDLGCAILLSHKKRYLIPLEFCKTIETE
jgi:hypothetical protein